MESGLEETRKLLFFKNKDSSEVDEVILKANKVLSRISTVDGESIKFLIKAAGVITKERMMGIIRLLKIEDLEK